MYSYITNKVACICAQHGDQDDDKMANHIGIHKLFARQNFPNHNSSQFSTIKILYDTVCCLEMPSNLFVCTLRTQLYMTL